MLEKAGATLSFLWAATFRLSTVTLNHRKFDSIYRVIGPGGFTLVAAAFRFIAFWKCAVIQDEHLSISDIWHLMQWRIDDGTAQRQSKILAHAQVAETCAMCDARVYQICMFVIYKYMTNIHVLVHGAIHCTVVVVVVLASTVKVTVLSGSGL